MIDLTIHPVFPKPHDHFPVHHYLSRQFSVFSNYFFESMRYHSDLNHQYSILKQRDVCLFAGRYLRQTATYQVSNLRVLGALIGPQHLHRYLPISPCKFSSQLFQISPNHFQAIIDAFECLGVHLV